MPASRPSSRGPQGSARARASARPGTRSSTARPAGRPGAPRPRVAGRARSAAPVRPRFTSRAAVLVLVVAVLMVSYASSLRAWLEQREHLGGLRDSIAASEANIAALEREKARWDDPAYVRAQARERFGWVLPGEIGFQVLDEDGRPLGHEDSLADPAQAPEEYDPLWWQTAWASVEAAGDPEMVQRQQPTTRIRPPRSSGD